MISQANQLGIGASVAEDPRIDQVIVDDHVGLPQAFHPAQRNQLRIAGTGADEENTA